MTGKPQIVTVRPRAFEAATGDQAQAVEALEAVVTDTTGNGLSMTAAGLPSPSSRVAHSASVSAEDPMIAMCRVSVSGRVARVQSIRVDSNSSSFETRSCGALLRMRWSEDVTVSSS